MAERRIFTKTSKTGFITQDTDETPIIEEEIRTLEIKDRGTYWQVYELDRNNPEKALQRFQKRDYPDRETLIRDIKQDKLFLKHRREYKQRTSLGFINWIQSNYEIRQFRNTGQTAQLVALVRIKETSSGKIDYFTGYSRKLGRTSFASQKALDLARRQCKDMAVSKFQEFYGYPDGYIDIRDELEGYEKLSDLSFYEAEIVEERYQYIQKRAN
jgi:hypothetical protein